MSFVVKGSFGEIEVDRVINGLITPNKIILFNAMLVDGRKMFVGIIPINKGYQEALEQIQEINKILEGANCKKGKAAPAPKPKYKWGEWKEESSAYRDPFSGMPVPIKYLIRTNGKRVEIKFDDLKASASCNFAKGDKFNYKVGKELAERRLISKLVGLNANNLKLIMYALK